MTSGIKTLELARIYESQGYYKEAHDIYSFLNDQNPSNEISAGLSRMKKRMDQIESDDHHSDEFEDLAELIHSIEPEIGGQDQNTDELSFSTGKTMLQDLIDQWMSLNVLNEKVQKLI